MLVYKKGDLLKAKENVICHQCNTKGVFGGGLAYQIKQVYPQCEIDAKSVSELDEPIGIYIMSEIGKNKLVANCFSQKENYDTDYFAIRQIFTSLLRKCKILNYSIAIPYKYGCGIANGDWNTVENIFKELSEEHDIDISIYELEGDGRKIMNKMIGYKATDKDMKCRNFQYVLGKEYKEDKADLCEQGFHFCENPLDILNYYNLCDARFFQIEAKDVSDDVRDDDTKRVSKKIKFSVELGIKDLVTASFNYLYEKCNIEKDVKDENIVATSGYGSKVATSGNSSQVATSGNYSQVATSGNYSQVATSGNYSQVATSGYGSKVATSGNSSQVATSGNYSQVATSGNSSQVATSGNYSQVNLEGTTSVGANIGRNGQIKGIKGCWIILAEYDNNYKILYVKSAMIDGETLKENTWYKLENGEFVEC